MECILTEHVGVGHAAEWGSLHLSLVGCIGDDAQLA